MSCDHNVRLKPATRTSRAGVEYVVPQTNAHYVKRHRTPKGVPANRAERRSRETRSQRIARQRRNGGGIRA